MVPCQPRARARCTQWTAIALAKASKVGRGADSQRSKRRRRNSGGLPTRPRFEPLLEAGVIKFLDESGDRLQSRQSEAVNRGAFERD